MSDALDTSLYPGHHAATRPDHPAVIMGASGEVLTYAELDDQANRLSQVFGPPG